MSACDCCGVDHDREDALADARRDKESAEARLMLVMDFVAAERSKRENYAAMKAGHGGQIVGDSHSPRLPPSVLHELEKLMKDNTGAWVAKGLREQAERLAKAESDARVWQEGCERWHEKAKESEARVVEAGEVAPMPICGWCGMPMADVEEFRAHAVACEKSPPVQRALAAEARAERAEDERDVAQAASTHLLAESFTHSAERVALRQRALAAEAERDRGLADMLRFQAAYIKADHERLAAEAEAKRAKEALRLLLTEVEQSGNGNAKDFGWPPALSAARTVLGDGPFNSLGIKIVAVPRDALAKEADHE